MSACGRASSSSAPSDAGVVGSGASPGARAAAQHMSDAGATRIMAIRPATVVANGGLAAVCDKASAAGASATAASNYCEWRELIAANSMPEDDPNGNVNPLPGQTDDRWGPKHTGAKKLASMYSWHKRLLETTGVALGATLMLADLLLLLYRAPELGAAAHTVLLAAVLGIVVADFLSGLVHWASDTWGSVDMPVFGAYFIRPFREHHVDPTAITRHDFIEVNGDAFLLCSYKLGVILQQHMGMAGDELRPHYHWHWFWLLLAFYVSITNQIHKWAHTYFGLPAGIMWLQRAHLILPRQHHKIHHVAPHAVHYCITTGWLNAPLDYVHFWRRAERLVTAVTGATPRCDDMKWAMK